jgi:hypothetical protein
LFLFVGGIEGAAGAEFDVHHVFGRHGDRFWLHVKEERKERVENGGRKEVWKAL